MNEAIARIEALDSVQRRGDANPDGDARRLG
jgi:hypothetical protein